MRAAVLRTASGALDVEDVDLLSLDPHRVLVRTHASPFCSTDVKNARGELPKVLPTILGHASIGEIVEVGSLVTGLAVGQRVVVPGTPECSTCYFCSIGRPDQCSELFDINGNYPKVATTADGRSVSCAGCVGGYAEYMSISENQAFPVDSDLPSDVLSLLGCGITTGVGSVLNIAKVQPGQSVAIIGSGHVGLWALQAARLVEAEPIVVVDPHPGRREVALQMGASHTAAPDEALGVIRDVTAGRGADVVIEAAGPVDSQRLAVEASRRAGTVVLSGVHRMDALVPLPQVKIALESRQIISTQNGGVRMRRDLPRYTSLLERGLMDATPILTRRYALDDINAALQRSDRLEDISGVVVFPT